MPELLLLALFDVVVILARRQWGRKVNSKYFDKYYHFSDLFEKDDCNIFKELRGGYECMYTILGYFIRNYVVLILVSYD